MGTVSIKQPRRVGYDMAGLFCRPFIERLNRIHSELQRGRFPNCRTLAEMLEVSGKTIQRDIDFMRDRLRLPIEFNPLTRGYYYSAPVTRFPACELKVQMETATPEESLVLRVAERAIRKFRGTKLEDSLVRGLEMLRSRCAA